MLTEMAKMSLDDGLVLQIHPGSWRNHSPAILGRFGRDKGFDIPTRTDYVAALKPLLDRGRHWNAISPSSSLRSTNRAMRANWRRWPASIPA